MSRFLLIYLLLASFVYSHDSWDDRSSFDTPGTVLFTGAAYGAGRFLIVGYGNGVPCAMFTSLNGRTDWVSQTLPSFVVPESVAYGAGKFVVVDPFGKIYTSPSGETGTWTARTSGISRRIRCIRYLNGIFVAGANAYQDPEGDPAESYTEILTSLTGETWVSHKFPADSPTLANFAYDVTDFAFKPGSGGGDGVWVVGVNVTNTFLSADESFTNLTRAGMLAAGGDQHIAYGNSKFVVASATGGGGKLWYSATGTEGWTQAVLPGGITVADMSGIFHDGDRFVATGSTISGSNPPVPAILHSTDGVTWTLAATIPTSSTNLLWALRADGLWLAGGTGKTLFTSGASSVSLSEIEVETPVDSPITDGAALSFGAVEIGESTSHAIRIRNTGDEPLSGLTVSLNGAHASNFSFAPLGATALEPGAFADLTVTFTPKSAGNRIAGLHITSNDYDENPFDISLNGIGAPKLIVTPGLARGVDDLASERAARAGDTVRYGLQVEVAKAAASSVVVWLTVPHPSQVGWPKQVTGISHGGVYTPTPVTVSGVAVPAPSVYWNLGSLPIGKLGHELIFAFNVPEAAPDGLTYSNTSGGSSTTASAAAGSALLTIGTPGLPPADGSVGYTIVRDDYEGQVTLTFADWIDPEGNTPLTYGVRITTAEGSEEILVPDGPQSAIAFTVPLTFPGPLLKARIKDSLGHVTEQLVNAQSLADIEVATAASAVIPDDGALSLGDVGLGGIQTAELFIRNRGVFPLTDLAVSLSGPNAASFTVSPPPDTSTSLMGGNIPLQIRFTPSKTGAHSATLRITSNDADESPFDITLTASGVSAGVNPTVKTVAATALGNDTARLNGLINDKGSARAVWFEYGPTASLGMRMDATPATLNSGKDTAVNAVLTGLAPHTRYHYRVRAAGVAGGASGAIMSFTTTNPPPQGVADTFEITLGSTVQLDVLQNDISPDGDAISIVSNTALVPSVAGKLTKSGNDFVFAASSIFNGATFTYKVKDPFGGVSGPVTVVLTQGLCGINPAITDRPAAAHSYPVTVTTTALWSANESLPWVTVSPASGSGDGVVTIALQANTTKTERSGTVLIGGYPHDVYQSGVSKPTLQMPDSIMEGIVASPYSLLIPTTNFPVTYAVTNLPPGLTINANTGLISGIPTKAGKYTVTVKAKNAAGSADLSPTFDIHIAALGEGVVGTFHGLVDPQATINGNLGSRFEITTTKTGSYSGKLITGGATTNLKGLLEVDPAHPDDAFCSIEIPRTGAAPLIMDLSFSHDAHSIAGTLIDSDTLETTDVHAWRNVWTTTERASRYGGLYTFVLAPTDFDPSLPQGYGFGSFKLTSDSTGAITVSGKVADGSTFTCGTFVGPYGEILVYQSLYGGRGSLAGRTSVTLVTPSEEHTLNNFLTWTKGPPVVNSKDTLYQSGFGPLTLNVKGGRHPEVLVGGLVMNLTPGDANARIDFAGGGLDTESEEFGVTFSIQNPSATGKTNKAVIPTHTNKVVMPTLNAATGAFSGDFTLPGATAAQNRKVPYQGQIVRTVDGLEGFGYFILPESTAVTATRRSGNVVLRPAK